MIKNITERCDCASDGGDVISENVGVLFSENPIAIDKASLDLVKQANDGKDVFEKSNNKDSMLQVNFAEEYCDWDDEYELFEMNNE